MRYIFSFILIGMIFVSYQGWYLDIRYVTGWEVIDYNKPISTSKDITEIANIINKKHLELDRIIILNWKRLEPPPTPKAQD